jgi:hypothetical protein
MWKGDSDSMNPSADTATPNDPESIIPLLTEYCTGVFLESIDDFFIVIHHVASIYQDLSYIKPPYIKRQE